MGENPTASGRFRSSFLSALRRWRQVSMSADTLTIARLAPIRLTPQNRGARSSRIHFPAFEADPRPSCR